MSGECTVGSVSFKDTPDDDLADASKTALNSFLHGEIEYFLLRLL